MDELTVTRECLVRLARETLDTVGVSGDRRAELMHVAETVERVLVSGWRFGDCGCLVGSLYPDINSRLEKMRSETMDAGGLSMDLYRVGIEFNSRLLDVLPVESEVDHEFEHETVLVVG